MNRIAAFALAVAFIPHPGWCQSVTDTDLTAAFVAFNARVATYDKAACKGATDQSFLVLTGATTNQPSEVQCQASMAFILACDSLAINAGLDNATILDRVSTYGDLAGKIQNGTGTDTLRKAQALELAKQAPAGIAPAALAENIFNDCVGLLPKNS